MNIEKRQYKMKILNEDDDTIEVDLVLSNPMLIGLFICGKFKLLDGHMYHENSVIKLRYDLIGRKSKEYLNEDNFFDFYNDVLPLRRDMTIISESILLSASRHRMAFIAEDLHV